MPDYIVCLRAESRIRINRRPYYEDGEAKSLVLGLPGAKIAIFDWFVPIADEVRVPNGLIVQVGLSAMNMEEAVTNATRVATYALSTVSCATMSAVGAPLPLWAYDATPGLADREYWHYVYDLSGRESTRRLEFGNLIALLDKLDPFLSDASVRPDHKDRVQRAIVSFRRGLADNDDVLTEFLIAWSSMEGLDCVYRKVLPSASTRDFMDGVQDALTQLGHGTAFTTLKDLRDDIAHGSLSMQDAINTARANLELVRRAFMLMILRILKVDDAACTQIIDQPSFKGTFPFHLKFLCTVAFNPPGDVSDSAAHPVVRSTCHGIRYDKDGDTLHTTPDWRLCPEGFESMQVSAYEYWGDSGSRLEFRQGEAKVIKKGQTE